MENVREQILRNNREWWPGGCSVYRVRLTTSLHIHLVFPHCILPELEHEEKPKIFILHYFTEFHQ